MLCSMCPDCVLNRTGSLSGVKLNLSGEPIHTGRLSDRREMTWAASICYVTLSHYKCAIIYCKEIKCYLRGAQMDKWRLLVVLVFVSTVDMEALIFFASRGWIKREFAVSQCCI